MNNGYLDINNQIKTIKNKNFKISNNFHMVLKKINYYNLMSYKNFLYEDGKEHNYKSELNTDYLLKLYQFDNKIKKYINDAFIALKNIYINAISDYFGMSENGFCEKGYLNISLYNNNFIYKIYNDLKENNENVRFYFINHKFIPIWVLLNSFNYSQFIDFYESFKSNIRSNIDDIVGIEYNKELMDYSKSIYLLLLSNDKVLDYKQANLKIVDLLNWLQLYNININKVKEQYKQIIKKIPCIYCKDIKRVSGIVIGDDV